MHMIMTRYSYQFYNLKFYHLISLKPVIYRFYNLEYNLLIKIIFDSSQLLTDESYKEINQKTFRDEKFLDKLIEIILECSSKENNKHSDRQILKCLTLLNYL
jgi:hypothetical protein